MTEYMNELSLRIATCVDCINEDIMLMRNTSEVADIRNLGLEVVQTVLILTDLLTEFKSSPEVLFPEKINV